MHPQLTRLTTPTNLSVDLGDVKRHIGIAHNDLDADLMLWIQSAEDDLAFYTGRAAVEADWQETRPAFPCRGSAMELRRLPLSTITSIDYFDETGTPQVLADYQTQFADNNFTRLWPAVGGDWPTTESGNINAVTVRYTAGYTTTPPRVADFIRHYCQLRYQNPAGELSPAEQLGLEAARNDLFVRHYALTEMY